MKKFLSLALVLCLLLCSCGTSTTTSDPEETGNETTANTSAETTTDSQQKDATPPEESNQEELVTVYLLDKTSLYDSGYSKYTYDDYYNVDTCRVYTIENELMYTSYFEDKDRNGMPRKYRNSWEGYDDDIWALSWFEDGKIKAEEYSPDLSGSKYDYNYAGNVSEIRQYYEGGLEFVTRFFYDGETLTGVSCTYGDGGPMFKGIVEYGRIIEKLWYDTDGGWSYSEHFKYDKNGNLIQKELETYDERYVYKTFTYKEVQVDASRANYLIEQQKYIISTN